MWSERKCTNFDEFDLIIGTMALAVKIVRKSCWNMLKKRTSKGDRSAKRESRKFMGETI
jgi:hypothetical protein